MTPQELETLVIAASNVNEPQKQWEATNLLNQWVQMDERVVVRPLIELLRHSRQESATFYALTTLQRLELSLSEDRIELRRLLLSGSDTSSLAATPYLETKVGVVLSRLIWMDFCSSRGNNNALWPNAFDDITTRASPTLFLRTLNTLLQDLTQTTERTLDAATRIKDTMRGYGEPNDANNHNAMNPQQVVPVEQSIVARLMGAVTSILERSCSTENGFHTNEGGATNFAETKGVCKQLALRVMKGFISWVDLSLVVQETVLALLFACLENNDEASAVVAVECLEELVARGMDTDRKMALLQSTNLLPRIRERVDLDTVDVSPIEVVIEVAKFLNTTGLEILPLWQQASSKESSFLLLLQQVLDMFFRCFAYDDIDVSGAVIPLARTVAETLGEDKEQVIPQLLTILYQQMRYPTDFQFDYEDDDEAEEEVYRTELRKLYQKLIREAPEVCLQFLCQALANLPVPISTSPTPQVEAAVRLLYHYGEGVRPPPGLKVVMKNQTFRSILVALHQSDIAAHPHREVLILYYDTAVRYAPLFKDQPGLLPPLLEAMSGSRGLQHPHTRVRSRSCYLLLRLVKALGVILRPYVETAVTGILGLLSSPKEYPLRDDDSLYLFETIGLLLGKTGLSATDQHQSLSRIMTPHIGTIRETLQSIPRDPQYFGEVLANSIAAITYLSKGFSKPSSNEVKAILAEALTTTLAVLDSLPTHDQVRRNSAVFFQRMIQCLGNQVLPQAPFFLRQVIEHSNTAEDLQDSAQMFNQLCIKFKREACAAIDKALLPFVYKCHAVMRNAAEATVNDNNNNDGGTAILPPHMQIEQLSIQKLTFLVLQHVVTYRVTDVLLTPTNAVGLEDVLRIMHEGAVSVEDPVVKKTCIQFFREVMDQWGQQQTEIFFRYALQVFYPAMMTQCFLDPSFDPTDAMRARCVFEFAQFLALVPREAFDYYIIGSSSWPADVQNAFRAATKASDIEKCLLALISTTPNR